MFQRATETLESFSAPCVAVCIPTMTRICRIFLLLLSSTFLVTSKPSTPRGVNPSLASHYVGADGFFKCLDGSKTVPFAKVNDDYCDCPDGSDEPGTSACPEGSFFCRNRGHEPKALPSSFVDDGICDCCDGTDERQGCTNTCLGQATARIKEIEVKIDDHGKALQKKQEYMEQAVSLREGFNKRFGEIDNDIAAQQNLVDELKVKKEELEAVEKAELERQEQERQEKERLEQEQQQQGGGDETLKGTPAEGRQLVQSSGDANEVSSQPAEPEPAEAETHTPEASDSTNEEIDKEELGRRIASQWTHDPAAASVDEHSHDSHDYHEGEDDDRFAHHPYHDEEGEHRELDHTQHHVPEPPATPAGQAAAEYEQARNKLQELQDEKETLAKRLQYDYGPNDEFLPLVGRCFNAVETKYTYEMCFFDKARQKESHQTTDLGSWKGFGDRYHYALWDEGAWCWQGPNRSLNVTLSCGLEEAAWGGDEPSKCVYAAQFKTPAACHQEELGDLQAQLEDLRLLEQAVQAEIAAEEGARSADSSTSHDEL